MSPTPRLTRTWCQECLDDTSIDFPHIPAAICAICGAQLCGAHIAPHLAAEHFCSLSLRGFPRPAPETQGTES